MMHLRYIIRKNILRRKCIMYLATIYGMPVWQIVLIVVIIFVASFIYVSIKEKVNRGKASNGEDKKAVADAVNAIVPAGEACTSAFATWEFTKWQGKTKTTSYWYYGIAFNDNMITIVSLDFNRGDLVVKNSVVIEKQDVGIVNSKKGESWVELYDNSQKEIVSLMVLPENLNDDKFHPLNILQKEETEAFVSWKDKWMDDINTAKGITVTGKQKKPISK